MLRFLRAGRPGFPRSSIERWRDAATDFVFPPRCAVCDAGGFLLCDDCRAGFTRAAPPRCPRCWTPSETAGAATSAAGVCDRCHLDPPPCSGPCGLPSSLRALSVARFSPSSIRG